MGLLNWGYELGDIESYFKEWVMMENEVSRRVELRDGERYCLIILCIIGVELCLSLGGFVNFIFMRDNEFFFCLSYLEVGFYFL